MPLAIWSYCLNKHVVRNVYSIEKYSKKSYANLTVFISNMFSEFNKMHKIEIKQVLFDGRDRKYIYNFIWLSSQPFKHIFKFEFQEISSEAKEYRTNIALYIFQGITLLHSALTLQKSSSQFQLSKLGSYCQ